MGSQRIKSSDVARTQDDLILRERQRYEDKYIAPGEFEPRDYGYGTCLFCGQRFKKNSPTQKYCDDTCREASYKESKQKVATNSKTRDQLLDEIRTQKARYVKLEKKYNALISTLGKDK